MNSAAQDKTKTPECGICAAFGVFLTDKLLTDEGVCLVCLLCLMCLLCL